MNEKGSSKLLMLTFCQWDEALQPSFHMKRYSSHCLFWLTKCQKQSIYFIIIEDKKDPFDNTELKI